jgi:hypothetical protein
MKLTSQMPFVVDFLDAKLLAGQPRGIEYGII